jgi:hypothetical protein
MALSAVVVNTLRHSNSLVGFTGGSIIGDGDVVNYTVPSGSVAPVPEPSSLVLFPGGLAWLVFGLTRRFGKKPAT